MSHTLNIHIAQINPVVGDLEHNRRQILQLWENVPENIDLVVFPELAVTGYPPEDLVLKPFFLGQVHKTVHKITEASARYKPAALIGCPWVIEDRTYNAVHLIENSKIHSTVTKSNLPNYDVFDEMRIFTPGPLPSPMEFRGFSLGVLICEDMWNKEAAAHLKKQGAELLIVPNASPFDTEKIAVRQSHARARAQETGLPLLYVNQIGGQDELVFDGASFVMDERGDIVFQAAQFKKAGESLSFRRGDRWTVNAPQSHVLPDPLHAIYQALVLGLRDYSGKNNFPGVLIGLSGGIDSALAAVIAVDALGPENIHAVMMPSRFTSEESLEDADALAKNLDIRLDTIPIESPVEEINSIVLDYAKYEESPVTFENIQSRLRGLILMALSNATGKMVLSTGNKSEMAVGYATLYGDMCGGFNALKDIYKTKVYALARWRNTQDKNAAIPERVLTRAPSAELRADQTDQDSLPPYEELDDILGCLIEHDMGLDEILARGHNLKTVSRVWKMLDRAEYKRRQAPPGVKISPRSFGRDRRYPITNHFTSILPAKGQKS